MLYGRQILVQSLSDVLAAKENRVGGGSKGVDSEEDRRVQPIPFGHVPSSYRAHAVYVCDIPGYATNDSLVKFLSMAGPSGRDGSFVSARIVGCGLRGGPGDAYVEFETQDQQNAALKLTYEQLIMDGVQMTIRQWDDSARPRSSFVPFLVIQGSQTNDDNIFTTNGK